MNLSQWSIIKKCVNMEELIQVPVGLIVDSPWIPGYVGISTMDYFTIPEKWLEANIKIIKDFPKIIFLPGFWVEYGMATEPSGFGCKINFYPDRTPTINHIINSPEEAEDIFVPNPQTDGLMPFVLNIYRNIEPKVKDLGRCIKVVAARGPLTIASHLMGVTNFLIGLKTDPANTHKLLKKTTTLAKNWLEAQAEVLSEVEGIMVLDDIVGFLSQDDYLEFAHPYLKEIFDAFPQCIKMYHNDSDNIVCFSYLQDLSINIFNFTHLQDIAKVRQLVGNKICLLGNIPPLDVLTNGTPDMVAEAAVNCLNQHGNKAGIILSAGGGTSPGTPGRNIHALIKATANY
ncbi:Uroporphyrinogen decarboxylase [Moorella thermoacetica]|uniref:Uroporphyrinogen decarboxylase n=1 Tax=Neomoorella thermoacetica TaxID=1525 RepID=A0AAC9HFD8_NEOTH|nr:uroporphyrinogen decarboxylase family protein [Moorella thermoacetica]AOQ22839.1 Uroporphyrinogen decarboxylase [Moorella thermoacetica]TYL10021.1 Uroporphyrinogen decarboxylase [Moorella thermoacetica]